ncbi:uncharacterized protein LOC110992063 isoform X2 [Pieris rapae]|uniref:uncharacterized protein LOC110992063 isoform X2 n=1 Tax=Pieris rapae TaxID=64459 RepID=UPI001E27D7F3|nr:uncharacterized protein LOC110992063 isoform X2 [Pieris rapae]
MTSPKESSDVINFKEERAISTEPKDLTDLPPSGTSLHKRRRGEPPATLTVKSPQTPSDAEGSSPCTAGPTPEESWGIPDDTDVEGICDRMLQRLKDKDDPASKCGKDIAQRTKDTLEALDHLEKLLQLLDQFVNLKEKNHKIIKRLNDVNSLIRLHNAYKRIDQENENLKNESREIELINEALDAELECEYGQALFDSILGRSMKRSGSKWKSHGRFGGSLLRKQRSRSAGGEDSDAPLGMPLRRRSDGVFPKEVEKSKVSNWTRVKSAFKWEKAQWPTSTIGGVAAVAAGAMVGAVALTGSSPSAPGLPNPEPRDSASLTPGSAMSLTPNSSCEELRLESGMSRKNPMLRLDDNDNSFLHAPMQDDSSTSPSPNKLHKSRWGKMRNIIQTHRESVKKKRPPKSPDLVPGRRRSFSDGGDSDAPPALTLTIPSSEELESEGPQPALRKQRSLELGARPPPRPRDSKWSRVKRAFLTHAASASVPSSPSRHSAFFTDPDTEGLSSGCEASGVRDEIARDYAALQSRLRREFSDRHPGKVDVMRALRPVATEDQLSADYHNKLMEWRMKGVKQPPPIPARKDLSEDFLKKWDEWTRMKETNSVPTWEEEAKPDEVLVQTSTGLFKFHGISRSFTRKLHEWEKSRGIAPEASTSALLQEAKARNKVPSALTRTQSDGSVGPVFAGGRVHASSLSVNDAEDLENLLDDEDCEDGNAREALLIEIEAEEVCTAAPLVAVSPRHTPQKPVYTYGPAEARLLCETTSAITGTAVVQSNGSDSRIIKTKEQTINHKIIREQSTTEKTRRKISRQKSREEDAKFIRKTIEEIERGPLKDYSETDNITEAQSMSKSISIKSLKIDSSKEQNDSDKDEKRNNGKKKKTSRARLEREQSKPSETDTEPEVDTVTVEIPRRKKRPRRQSEKPRTPPTSHHSETEGEVFVLKIKTQDVHDKPPEVIVKTTRKIFSPIVRSGETIPRAVIPVDVEELEPSQTQFTQPVHDSKTSLQSKSSGKSSGDLQDDEQKKNSRPPLPTSPTSQRKKETAPAIKIMIQRYNKKINEAPPSGGSSGTTSPLWRSPKSERKRPPDMPVGVNIRNNPFLEREVQKSASACQLSQDQLMSEKCLTPADDGVLKSHSANTLHPQNEEVEDVHIRETTPSMETIIPRLEKIHQNLEEINQRSEEMFEKPLLLNPSFMRSISAVEDNCTLIRMTSRAARIKEARERFLSSSPSMRREGTSSASDLRPGDRSSQVSCESDAAEGQSSNPDSPLGRSASTGMVNVERETWQRVAENGSRRDRPRSRFSLARLAAKLRRKDESAVSRLCRQSLLVQLRNKQ